MRIPSLNLNRFNPFNWFKANAGDLNQTRSIPINRAGIKAEMGSPVVSLNLSYYSPAIKMHQENDRLFELFFGAFNFPAVLSRSIFYGTSHRFGSDLFRSDVSLSNDKNVVLIAIEVDGYDRTEFSIELRNSQLVLTGEKHKNSVPDWLGFFRTGQDCGRLRRVISLPDYIDVNKAEATLIDGVLTEAIPCIEADIRFARRIVIN